MRHRFGNNIVLETRYPLYYGIAVYKDLATNDVYVIKVHDVQKIDDVNEFLSIARKLT